jgi:hypothetical protein
VTRLDVRWYELLDAYQGIASDDPELAPLLRLDNSQVSCRAMIGDDDVPVVQIPVKGAVRSFEQRRAFAESLCEPVLRNAIHAALDGPGPFRAFDQALAQVPIEAERWIEEERIQDVEQLYGWLRRAGVEPEPAPDTSRKIIEFPIRRETT